MSDTVSTLALIEQAFRRLQIKAEDEALTADQLAYAGATLIGLHAELSKAAPMTFWPNAIPQELLIPLGNLLAVEIGPSYGVAVEARGKALARVMAVIRPDDRSEEEIYDSPIYY
jgi:hypothetical protein